MGLALTKPTSMMLFIADHIVKNPIDILCDVFVKATSYVFRIDFIILDYEFDIDVHIIFKRPFQSMGTT